VPAAELLMIGYGGRQHIRRNALQHMHQEITITKNKGSFTQEESLLELVRQGHLDREEAMLCAMARRGPFSRSPDCWGSVLVGWAADAPAVLRCGA